MAEIVMQHDAPEEAFVNGWYQMVVWGHRDKPQRPPPAKQFGDQVMFILKIPEGQKFAGKAAFYFLLKKLTPSPKNKLSWFLLTLGVMLPELDGKFDFDQTTGKYLNVKLEQHGEFLNVMEIRPCPQPSQTATATAAPSTTTPEPPKPAPTVVQPKPVAVAVKTTPVVVTVEVPKVSQQPAVEEEDEVLDF